MRRLRRLADDLHDKVALALALKVEAHELERVEQGAQRGELHLGRRLLFPCALNDGREDLVRLGGEHGGIDDFTREADGLERRLALARVVQITDRREELRHEVRPHAARQFDGGDGGGDLRRDGAGTRLAAAQRHEHLALDLIARFCRKRRPAVGIVLRTPGLARHERVFESEAGGGADVHEGSLRRHLTRQRCHVHGVAITRRCLQRLLGGLSGGMVRRQGVGEQFTGIHLLSCWGLEGKKHRACVGHNSQSGNGAS